MKKDLSNVLFDECMKRMKEIAEEFLDKDAITHLIYQSMIDGVESYLNDNHSQIIEIVSDRIAENFSDFDYYIKMTKKKRED